MISEILIAVLPVAATLATLLISQRHARRVTADERDARAAESAADREFRAHENRHVDRREAAIRMVGAAEDEVAAIRQWEYRGEYGRLSPGDIYEDHPFTELNAAYATLMMLADETVCRAAATLRDAVITCFNGGHDRWGGYDDALGRFQESSRSMLTST